MRTLVGFLLLCVWLALGVVSGLENGLARTPPMGWNTWNLFSCNTNCTTNPNTCVSEKLIMQTADAFVKYGLNEVGYEYINIGTITRSIQSCMLKEHPIIL